VYVLLGTMLKIGYDYDLIRMSLDENKYDATYATYMLLENKKDVSDIS